VTKIVDTMTTVDSGVVVVSLSVGVSKVVEEMALDDCSTVAVAELLVAMDDEDCVIVDSREMTEWVNFVGSLVVDA
jgi:hypothetical protein